MIKMARIVFFGWLHILCRFPKVNTYSKHPEDYDLDVRFRQVKGLLEKLNKSSFHIDFLIEGKENIPQGQCLFVGNHASLFDPVAMVMILDRPVGFLCKKEVASMPFASQVAKALDSTFIDRDDLRSEITAIANLEKKMRNDKRLSYVIFPEGTRSKGPDFKLLPFHPGSFKVATRLSLPIVPFSFYLTDRILSQHYHYKRYPVQVTFAKPILPEEYDNLDTRAISEMARERILAAQEKQRERDRRLVMRLNGYSEKKTDKVLHYLPKK